MELVLYHFFPDTLNMYGDRGNIISLKKRCEWRGITLQVKKLRHQMIKKRDVIYS